MTRPRPLEASTFILVLGNLIAHRGGIEAIGPHRPRHAQTKPTAGWLSRRTSGAEDTPSSVGDIACHRQIAQSCGASSSIGESVVARLRGGRSMRQSGSVDEDEGEDGDLGDAIAGEHEEDEEEEEEEAVLYDEKAVEWMMQQLCMYQTRTALISNPLAAKGYKLREIVPSPRGLICALSTEERRMDCRMYVEAEVGKKVVAPCKCKGTQKWISFSALNSERRKETTKWKNCPTCQGPIDYKLYEAYGGGVGKAISATLNNVGATRAVLGALAGVLCLIFSPVLHAIVVRILTSGVLWQNYHRIDSIVHMPLPIQIMGIRFLMKFTYDKLLVLESVVRQYLTDVESQILETRLPVTVDVREDGEEVHVAHRRP